MTRTNQWMIAAAATLLLAISAPGLAQYRDGYDRDSRYGQYERDRYGNYQQNPPGVYRDDRYDRNDQRYDARYDQRSDSRYENRDQYVTQSRSGEYADLFTVRAQGDSRYVYGVDDPRYEPRDPQARQYSGSETISGQVRRVTTETHDGVQHRHVALRTSSGSDITVDLGPVSGLTQLRVESGNQIRLMGDYRSVEGRREFIANRIQINNEQRLFIERDMTQQWVQGHVIDPNPREGGVALRTDEGRVVRIDLGAADNQIRLQEGQRLQALGTLTQVGGERVLLATQLRSLRADPQASRTQEQEQTRQRTVEPEVDDEDYWRDVGSNLLENIFRD